MNGHCPAKCTDCGVVAAHEFLRVNQFLRERAYVVAEFAGLLPLAVVPEHLLDAVYVIKQLEVLQDHVGMPEVVEYPKVLAPLREVSIVFQDAGAYHVKSPGVH